MSKETKHVMGGKFNFKSNRTGDAGYRNFDKHADYYNYNDRKRNLETNSQANSFAGKQMATLYNPFSLKNNQPKWPDGKAQYSIGRKHQHAAEITDNNFVVVLFPGLTNWCIAAKHDGTTATLLANHGSTLSVKYAHGVDTGSHWWNVGSGIADHFETWRPVSYAMVIKNINNDEWNEGWFEAIRTPRNVFMETFGLSTEDTTENSNPQVFVANAVPDAVSMQAWFNSMKWTNQPTYVTGKLKDIGNYMFQLNNQKRDNDFLKVRNLSLHSEALNEETVNVYNDTANIAIPKIGLESGSTITAGEIKNFENTVIHDSLDIVLVRIHGNTDEENKTKMLIHTCANQEFMCAENSEFAQYQSAAYPALYELNSYLEYRSKFSKIPMQYNKNV